jgi:hypothetical protein
MKTTRILNVTINPACLNITTVMQMRFEICEALDRFPVRGRGVLNVFVGRVSDV